MTNLDTCRWCDGPHPIEFCPHVLAAFVAGYGGTERSATTQLCANCGEAPRLPGPRQSYCRECLRAVGRRNYARHKDAYNAQKSARYYRMKAAAEGKGGAAVDVTQRK